MPSLITTWAVILLLCASAASARAESIESFSLDNTDVSNTTKSVSGDTLTVLLEDITIGGVTFDATLTVKGSASLTQTSSGIGVSGGGSDLVNNLEALTFSMAVDSVDGGTVIFGGFHALDLTFFTTSGETVVFSTDADLSSTWDNFLTHTSLSDPDISGTAPTYFTLFGLDGVDANGNKVTTSFRIDGIDAAFSTVAAVPEPGSFALLGMAGTLYLLRRWRRRRARCY
jgi:hypothetical protein